MDEETRKKTVLAVLGMGGGCALLLAVLGGTSLMIAHLSDPAGHGTSATVEQPSAPSAPAATGRPTAPTGKPTTGAKAKGTTEI